MRISIAILVAFLLVACGGGGSSTPAPTAAALQKGLIQPSDRVVPSTGYDLQIRPLTEPDPATSVLAQSKLPGTVILWVGVTKQTGFATFPAFVAQAAKYPNIRYAYLYDEVFWTGATAIGLDEPAILQAAAVAHQTNLKTVVTILPDVILDAAFKMVDVNAFDLIAIDVYPLSRPHDAGQLGACKYGDGGNLYSSLFYCAALKLRAQGFRGEIWYMPEGFGLHSVSDADLLDKLTLQRATIDQAAALGAAGVIPFGFYMGLDPTEPDLYQLAGTPFESLVTP